MLGFGYLVVILRDCGGKPNTHLDLQLRQNKSISSRKKRSRLKRTSSPKRGSNPSHLLSASARRSRPVSDEIFIAKRVGTITRQQAQRLREQGDLDKESKSSDEEVENFDEELGDPLTHFFGFMQNLGLGRSACDRGIGSMLGYETSLVRRHI